MLHLIDFHDLASKYSSVSSVEERTGHEVDQFGADITIACVIQTVSKLKNQKKTACKFGRIQCRPRVTLKRIYTRRNLTGEIFATKNSRQKLLDF